jgi:hypothetical protein
MIAFWDIAPYNVVEIDQSFGGAYHLHHQGKETHSCCCLLLLRCGWDNVPVELGLYRPFVRTPNDIYVNNMGAWNDNDTGKPKFTEINLSQYHFAYRESPVDWPGRELGSSCLSGVNLLLGTLWLLRNTTLRCFYKLIFYSNCVAAVKWHVHWRQVLLHHFLHLASGKLTSPRTSSGSARVGDCSMFARHLIYCCFVLTTVMIPYVGGPETGNLRIPTLLLS